MLKKPTIREKKKCRHLRRELLCRWIQVGWGYLGASLNKICDNYRSRKKIGSFWSTWTLEFILIHPWGRFYGRQYLWVLAFLSGLGSKNLCASPEHLTCLSSCVNYASCNSQRSFYVWTEIKKKLRTKICLNSSKRDSLYVTLLYSFLNLFIILYSLFLIFIPNLSLWCIAIFYISFQDVLSIFLNKLLC